jgi:transposase
VASGPPPPPRDWQEARHKRGLELHAQGWRPCEIADALGVSRQSVSTWISAEQEHGWITRPRPGRPPKLSIEQRNLIPELLSHGAEAYGFRGDVWTRARVREVIRREFHVAYGKTHVGKILKALEWTPHKPTVRASQRDDDAIERWRVETWPRLKEKAQIEGRTIVFVDESSFCLLPGVVRTYAPCGQQVIVHSALRYQHLSMMGGVTVAGQFYTLLRGPRENFGSAHVLGFIFHLGRLLGNLLVIWDGSPIHRGDVDAFLASGGAPYVHVESLPPYAPDLNPVEAVWQFLKNVELRNLSSADFEELRGHIDLATRRLRAKSHLVRSFFAEAGLAI